MSDLKFLKFVQKGYETYSGPIGKFTFENGMSTEPIYRVDRDTLSTAFQFVEVDEDGNEIEAGVAARLVAESAARAPTPGPLKRMTDAEASAEQERAKVVKSKLPTALHTRAELEAIADKHGIKGLREQVADKWGVRNRSIGLLIEEILAAQAEALKARQARIATATETEPAAPVSQPPITANVELGDDDAALEAAATGNMAAALNTQDNADADTVEPAAVDPAAGTADSGQAQPTGDLAGNASPVPEAEGAASDPASPVVTPASEKAE